MPDALSARRPSIAQTLALAAGQLERAGVGHGQREATSLWAAVAGVARGEVWLRRDDAPAEAVAAHFWEAVQRRMQSGGSRSAGSSSGSTRAR